MSQKQSQSGKKYRVNNFSGGVVDSDLFSREDDIKVKNGFALADNMLVLPSGAIITRPKIIAVSLLNNLYVNGFSATSFYETSKTTTYVADKTGIFSVKPLSKKNKFIDNKLPKKDDKGLVNTNLSDSRNGLLYSHATEGLLLFDTFNEKFRSVTINVDSRWFFQGISLEVKLSEGPENITAEQAFQKGDLPTRAIFVAAIVDSNGRSILSKALEINSLNSRSIINAQVSGSSGTFGGGSIQKVTIFAKQYVGDLVSRIVTRIGDLSDYKVVATNRSGSIEFAWADYLTSGSASKSISKVGFSSATAFFHGRMVVAGTDIPNRLYFSEFGDESNFSAPGFFGSSNPLNPFFFDIDYSGVLEIYNLISLDRLFVFTNQGVWVVYNTGNSNQDATFGYRVSRVSSVQCSKVRPIVVGSSIVFHSSSNNHLYSIASSPESGLGSFDLSLRSTDLFKDSPVTSIASVNADSYFVVATLKNGSFLITPLAIDQNILSWTRCYISPCRELVRVIKCLPYYDTSDYGFIFLCRVSKGSDYHLDEYEDLNNVHAIFTEMSSKVEDKDVDDVQVCKMSMKDIKNFNGNDPINLYDQFFQPLNLKTFIKKPIHSGLQTSPLYFLSPVGYKVGTIYIRSYHHGGYTIRPISVFSRNSKSSENKNMYKSFFSKVEPYITKYLHPWSEQKITINDGLAEDVSIQIANPSGQGMLLLELSMEIY